MATTLNEAKLALERKFSKYKVKTPTRIAYLGDGKGHATSNIVVPYNPMYIYARETFDSRRAFLVLNKSVPPKFNLPVVLGYKDDDPTVEQVLDIHYGTYELQSAASPTFGTKNHHWQHEFGGGDEVFIDPRQIKMGLIRPTTPPSMAVVVNSVTHHYTTWSRFPQTTSIDMTPYLPTGANKRWVLLAIDPTTNQLVYRAGFLFGSEVSFVDLLEGNLDGFVNIPSPSGDEIPIGAVLLTSTTTSLNWSATNNNIYPYRLHMGEANTRVLDRLEAVEGYLGFNQDLATTGAQSNTTDEFSGGGTTTVDLNVISATSRTQSDSAEATYPNNTSWQRYAASQNTIAEPIGNPIIHVGVLALEAGVTTASHTNHFHHVVYPTPFSASALIFINGWSTTEGAYTFSYSARSSASGASIYCRYFSASGTTVVGSIGALQWLAIGEK